MLADFSTNNTSIMRRFFHVYSISCWEPNADHNFFFRLPSQIMNSHQYSRKIIFFLNNSWSKSSFLGDEWLSHRYSVVMQTRSSFYVITGGRSVGKLRRVECGKPEWIFLPAMFRDTRIDWGLIFKWIKILILLTAQ